jgi:hypothetical protein
MTAEHAPRDVEGQQPNSDDESRETVEEHQDLEPPVEQQSIARGGGGGYGGSGGW